MLLLVEEETFILEIKIKGVGPRELLDQLLPLSVPFRQTIYGRGTAIVNPLGRPGWLFFCLRCSSGHHPPNNRLLSGPDDNCLTC